MSQTFRWDGPITGPATGGHARATPRPVAAQALDANADAVLRPSPGPRATRGAPRIRSTLGLADGWSAKRSRSWAAHRTGTVGER